MKKIISILAISACALMAHAQGLQTEITVDRVVEPSQKEAIRPDYLPIVSEAAGAPISLSAAEYNLPGSITTCLYKLKSVAWGDTIEHSPYRGYASIGYFPTVNIGANAGFRLIDTQKVNLSIYGQYNGHKYTRSDIDMQQNNAAAGLSLIAHPVENSCLSASLDYHFGSQLRPYFTISNFISNPSYKQYLYSSTEDKTQNANQIDINLGWNQRIGNLAYNLGFGYQHFDLSRGYDGLPTQKQGLVQFCAGVAMMRDDLRFLGIDIDGSFVNSDSFTDSNAGIVAFQPYVNVGRGAFRARLGFDFSAFTGGESGMKVSPNIRISYSPLDKPISVYANIIGKHEVTPISKLYAIAPYVSFQETCINMNAPVILQGGLNLGRFGGFGLGVYGEFAHVNTYMAPSIDYIPSEMFTTPNAPAGRVTYYTPSLVNCWRVGAKADFVYRTFLEIGASIEKGGSDADFASWYEWYDGAALRYKGYVKVNPIKELTITLSYIGRTDRKLPNWGYGSEYIYDLGDMSDLSLGASYAVTPQLTVFANLTNMLNSDYQLVGAVPAQGFSGLVGLSVKF